MTYNLDKNLLSSKICGHFFIGRLSKKSVANITNILIQGFVFIIGSSCETTRVVPKVYCETRRIQSIVI